jgi:hypothetical protein
MISNAERRFRYPATTRRGTLIVISVCLAAVMLAVLMSQSSLVDRVFTMTLATALGAWGIVIILTKEAILTNESLTVQTLLSRTTLRWTDVEDILESGRRVCLRGRRQRISLRQGDYGLSLESFGELRGEIRRRVDALLQQRWANISLGKDRSYSYPHMGIVHNAGYAIPLLLILIVFLAYPISAGIFSWEQSGFLAGAIALVAGFWVRDYRRSLKTLVLSQDEVREENGKNRAIRWLDVERLIVREGLVGYGSLVIVGGRGQKITIPRGIQRCGELMFLLTQNSRATIVDDAFEY